jgi:hypothetical protein
MRWILFFIILFLVKTPVYCQDTSLLKMINDSIDVNKTSTIVNGTFKGVYIINTQSVETPPKHALLLLIMHRFGKINDGAYNFFGLDNATMRLGFDYGITNRLSAAVGRSTFEKTFDGHIKYKLLRQTNGGVPFTLDVFEGIYYTSLKYTDKPYLNAKYRTSYTTSLLIARKFSRSFSLQLTPTLLHYNLMPAEIDHNDVWALGIGDRIKVTRRMSVNAEYTYVPSSQISSFTRYNSLSAGIDIETGGHVFQLHITNSQGMVEPMFIGKTTGTWRKGDIYFGFNISRAFNIGK